MTKFFLILPILIFGFLVVSPALASISFDSSGGIVEETSTTTLQWAQDMTSATSPISFLCAKTRGGDYITSVNWNTNEALTQLGSTIVFSGNNDQISLWYIINPSNVDDFYTVVASQAQNMSGTSVTYSGASSTQADIVANTRNYSETSTTNLTTQTTSSISNSWGIACGFNISTGGSAIVADDGGTTSELKHTSSFGQMGLFDTNSDLSVEFFDLHILSVGDSGNKIGAVVTSFAPPASPPPTISTSTIEEDFFDSVTTSLNYAIVIGIIIGICWKVFMPIG